MTGNGSVTTLSKLKSHTERVLEDVAHGEPTLITKHGRFKADAYAADTIDEGRQKANERAENGTHRKLKRAEQVVTEDQFTERPEWYINQLVGRAGKLRGNFN